MSMNRKLTAKDVEGLYKTIDEQKEQITRFQTKFRDVTHAYRGLLEEKKALEITIKALKTTSKSSLLKSNLLEVGNRSKYGSKSDLSALQASSRTPSVSDLSELETQSNADSADLDSSNPRILQNLNDLNQDEKINALTSNIQLLIDAKSKLERGFQLEKKKLRSDNEELIAKLNDSKNEYENRIKELRVSLKQSQTDREKLTNDLNSMVKTKNSEQEIKILSMQEENQSILFSLRNENNNLKQKFKNLMKQFENKCEEMVQCEQQAANLTTSHEKQMRDKEDMLSDMRDRLRNAENSSELRIGNLESKINELCIIISKYENGDNLDKDTISNYMNDKNNLDDEQISARTKPKQFESPADFDSALEQMQNLKSYIESTAKELNIKFDFNEIWFQNGSNLKQEQMENKKLSDQIGKLKDENRHLREEYEKYKIRTNYLIKSAKQATKETSSNIEQEEHYKQAIQKYKDEIDILNKRIHLAAKDKTEEIRLLNEKFEEYEAELRAEFKTHLDKAEHERLKSNAELEEQIVKQRERSMNLINEKEKELIRLRSNNNFHPSPGKKPSSDNKLTRSTSDNINLQNKLEGSLNGSLNNSLDVYENEDNEILNTTTRQSNEFINNENNRIIHYSHENAYKDMELNKLRVIKTDLEYKMKRLNDEHTVDIDRFQSQINVLKQEIERMNLMQERDELNSANLEYIKNVIFNYMTTKDKNVRTSMQNALTQILKFTKMERQKLNSVN